jgi:hypothetical protein
MALPATSVWEVRPTVGSDTNGGGFDSAMGGTDYSQQNAKNSSGNNKSTTDVVATGVATITSATASFTSAILGNIIYLAGSGITTGWYEVITFTNGTTVILDRSPGTGTGVTMNIGGALATITAAYGSAAVASNTIWIKATGSYTTTSAMTLSNSFVNGTPFYFIGYTTIRGDGGQATWTTATNSIQLMISGGTGCVNHCFININFTNTAGTSAPCFDGGLNGAMDGLRLVNCTFNGFTFAVKGAFSNAVNWDILGLIMESCSVTACTGAYAVGCSGLTFIIDTIIYSNTGDGVRMTITSSSGNGGPCIIERSILYNNGGNGLYCDGSNTIIPQSLWPILINSAIVANTNHGINIGGDNYSPIIVINTIIESQGGYGINTTSNGTGFVIFYANAYRANSSGDLNGGNLVKSGTDITLTAEPFTTVGSNWTLNNTSGGGAACKAVGFPSSIP